MAAEPARGYAKGRARREEILEEAVALFGEVGYRAASLREVAQRAGISAPGLLHHFASKEELLTAVLAHRDARDAGRFRIADAHGLGVLRRLVDLVADNARHEGLVELYCVLSAEATAPDHPAHAYFRRRYEVTRSTLLAAFEELAEQGSLRPGVPPRSAATGLLAVMDGLQVQWLLDRASVDMPAEVHRHLQGLLTVPL